VPDVDLIPLEREEVPHELANVAIVIGNQDAANVGSRE
jgi:hypothetical protein